jgi:hypothetical protein
MKKLIFVFAIGALSLTACNNESKHSEEEHEHGKTEEKAETNEDGHSHEGGEHEHGNSEEKADRNIQTSKEKNSSTTAIIDAYLQIKNGLVTDDKEVTATGGTALLSAFSAFDMTKLSSEQHKEYMEIYENAKEQAEHIVKSPIDHQREHFEVLSTDIDDMIALLGTEKTLYQDFCPMANGGKGAIWLSEKEEIQNPFYGSKMMTCGKIQKQIN